MTNSKRILMFFFFLLVPLVVGGISAALTGTAMTQFDSMNKPMLAPPAKLFPIVWTILYLLMGIVGYMIYSSKNSWRIVAMILFIGQLVFNFFWSLIFFNMEKYWVAFIWLMAMWVMIIALLVILCRVNIVAMFLLIPLALWSTFAAYLNLMIARLNA